MENWIVISECPNYSVSNYGKVKNNKTGKVLKGTVDRYGYNQIYLRNNGKQSNPLVHRLVAKAFLENPENKLTVNHKDGNKLNNRVENLEWSTHKEQIRHGFNTGLHSSVGEDNNHSILKEVDVIYIWENKLSVKEIVKKFGLSIGGASNIYRQRRWKHLLEKRPDLIRANKLT